MNKILTILLLSITLNAKALSPNEMLVVVGAVKYYNENCAGLNQNGVKKTPVAILEQNPLAISGYQTAVKFGCIGTKHEANKAGYGEYIN
jgi:hypothetical protein